MDDSAAIAHNHNYLLVVTQDPFKARVQILSGTAAYGSRAKTKKSNQQLQR